MRNDWFSESSSDDIHGKYVFGAFASAKSSGIFSGEGLKPSYSYIRIGFRYI